MLWPLALRGLPAAAPEPLLTQCPAAVWNFSANLWKVDSMYSLGSCVAHLSPLEGLGKHAAISSNQHAAGIGMWLGQTCGSSKNNYRNCSANACMNGVYVIWQIKYSLSRGEF